mmetsp:Transcript_23689/g.41971  ORF Transcript_23689/g.41971 Transcript_23689/m.41971 type:complete len:97 (+) Transcript_23689:98-388(+)
MDPLPLSPMSKLFGVGILRPKPESTGRKRTTESPVLPFFDLEIPHDPDVPGRLDGDDFGIGKPSDSTKEVEKANSADNPNPIDVPEVAGLLLCCAA